MSLNRVIVISETTLFGMCHPSYQAPSSKVMSVLLAQRSVVQEHPAQLHLGLEDLDLDAGQGEELSEEDSCECSLSAAISNLGLNLL